MARLYLLVLVVISTIAAQKFINYRVQFNNTCSTNVPPDVQPLNVCVAATALDLMETAGSMNPMAYNFSVEYSTNGLPSVVAIGNLEANSTCFWVPYFKFSSTSEELPLDAEVANYVPANNTELIWRFEQKTTIETAYIINHISPCGGLKQPPAMISVPTANGSTVLDVMTEAVRRNGSQYSFTADYDAAPDYRIRQVNGVAKNATCQWTAHVANPNGNATREPVPLSTVIQATGYTLTLNLSVPQPPTTTEAAPPQTTKGGAIPLRVSGGVIGMTSLMLLTLL